MHGYLDMITENLNLIVLFVIITHHVPEAHDTCIHAPEAHDTEAHATDYS